MSRKTCHITDLPPELQERIRERAGIVNEPVRPKGARAEEADATDAREEARKMLVRLAGLCIAGRGNEPADGWPEYTNSEWLARMVNLTLRRDSDA